MENDALLKKVNAGGRIVFDSPDKFCLVLRGRINISAPGELREIGPGGVLSSDMTAYAIENSEAMFVTLEKMKEILPALAARIVDGMKKKSGVEPGSPSAKHGGTVYLYSVDVQCPVCQGHFKANKLFESKLKQLSHDTEMRTHFEDIEPINYKVWVCPACLYANYINRFSELTASQRSTLQASSEKRRSFFASLAELDGNADATINNYKLVIECLTQIGAVPNIASAWLNLAWLNDDRGDTDMAATARQKALEAYEQFYYEGRSLTPPMELQALYIIGELQNSPAPPPVDGAGR